MADASALGADGSNPMEVQVLSPALSERSEHNGGEAKQLLALREDEKAAAMFLFERPVGAKGKNREAGLIKISVRKFISSRVLSQA